MKKDQKIKRKPQVNKHCDKHCEKSLTVAKTVAGTVQRKIAGEKCENEMNETKP